MIALTMERRIAAPPGAVFDWLADSSHYTAAPTVLRERRIRDGDGAPYGVGAIRQVTAVGAWFRERVTAYEPPHEFRYVIVKSVPRFEHEGGAIHVRAAGDGSHVVWTTRYDLATLWGGGPMAKLTAPLLKWSFETILQAADRALAR